GRALPPRRLPDRAGAHRPRGGRRLPRARRAALRLHPALPRLRGGLRRRDRAGRGGRVGGVAGPALRRARTGDLSRPEGPEHAAGEDRAGPPPPPSSLRAVPGVEPGPAPWCDEHRFFTFGKGETRCAAPGAGSAANRWGGLDLLLCLPSLRILLFRGLQSLVIGS